MVQDLVKNSKSQTAGLLMIIAPPPNFKPMIAVTPHYFGDLTQGSKEFQCLIDLKPIVTSETTPLVQDLSDHLDFACGKGGFRRFTLAGLQDFKPAKCLKLTEMFQEMLKPCPDAAASGYFIEWHSPPPSSVSQDSAFGHHNAHIWL